MNSGATSERVYGALKRRVLSGHYRPGERLEAATIGGELNSSITPVRDALHMLVGEGLVVTRTSDGFHVEGIDAVALEDLYRWNAEVIGIVVAAIAPRNDPSMIDHDSTTTIAALFAELARCSGNAEHVRAVSSLNDRLSAPRRAELRVLGDGGAEVADLLKRFADGSRREWRDIIARYHRTRIRRAPDIVRELYRGIEPPQTIGE